MDFKDQLESEFDDWTYSEQPEYSFLLSAERRRGPDPEATPLTDAPSFEPRVPLDSLDPLPCPTGGAVGDPFGQWTPSEIDGNYTMTFSNGKEIDEAGVTDESFPDTISVAKSPRGEAFSLGGYFSGYVRFGFSNPVVFWKASNNANLKKNLESPSLNPHQVKKISLIFEGRMRFSSLMVAFLLSQMNLRELEEKFYRQFIASKRFRNKLRKIFNKIQIVESEMEKELDEFVMFKANVEKLQFIIVKHVKTSLESFFARCENLEFLERKTGKKFNLGAFKAKLNDLSILNWCLNIDFFPLEQFYQAAATDLHKPSEIPKVTELEGKEIDLNDGFEVVTFWASLMVYVASLK